MPAFAYTILYVPDVENAIQFYVAAFGLEAAFIADDKSYGEVVTGSTKLGFASYSLADSNFSQSYRKSNSGEAPFGIEIGFTTHNVDETLQAAIAAGASLFAAPTTKPWGQTVAYVRDPQGFLVEICTPMD